MIIERLVEDKHLSRIILYLDLAWFEIMEYVYYLTTLCLPVLLFLITLKLTGNTNMWWKVFLTAFGLNVIFLFAWTDFVTKPLCSLSGCSQPDETTIVGCFQGAFFHAALTEELEKVVGACLVLFLVFRKHRINADGVFKATLAYGTNFGLVETLGKVRYNVIQSGVKDYVWDSSSYHIFEACTDDELIMLDTLYYTGRAIMCEELRLPKNPHEAKVDAIKMCILNMDRDGLEFGKPKNDEINIYGKQSGALIECIKRSLDTIYWEEANGLG